uniref:Small ribosomal subunit protein uS9m n=1 Tax=Clastoptera arizonana TaxID=38151 RepID=A0A1B6D3Y2_9HEMI
MISKKTFKIVYQLNTHNLIQSFKYLTCNNDKIRSCTFSTNSSLYDEVNANENQTTKSTAVKYGIREEKSSKAMRAYLERAKAYNDFMKLQSEEYIVGKRHLANIMGKDVETFTQKDIDAAIAYLLPSGLYDKKARPFLKPPEEVFPPKKEAEFDETGRPHHFLFYTGKPNYYGALHKLVSYFQELNAYEDSMIRKQLTPDPKLALNLDSSTFKTKDEYQTMFVEELSNAEFNNFVLTLERLMAHPYSYRLKDEIMLYRKPIMLQSTTFEPLQVEVLEDGRQFVTFKNSVRKTAVANVTLFSPGTGKISINGKDLTYFEDVQCREQLMFPLLFTGKTESVDVEATVTGGGTSGQAGAIRFGISWALRSFVSQDMIEKMRLAGLLTRDRRRRERKKPGQMKARRKFT